MTTRRRFLQGMTTLAAASALPGELRAQSRSAAAWNSGDLVHLLPTVSDERMLIKASFVRALAKPPRLLVDKRTASARSTRRQRRALGVLHRRPAARPALHAAARRRRREKARRPLAAEDIPVSGREERIAAGADVYLPGRARRSQALPADAAAHPPRGAGPVVRARCADRERRPGLLGSRSEEHTS